MVTMGIDLRVFHSVFALFCYQGNVGILRKCSLLLYFLEQIM